MKSYHGSQEIKDKYIARVRAHREADELIRGTGWDNGRGCAVGCTLNAYNHQAYETELGIPAVVAYLEDSIFEGLPEDLAMAWPERFLQAIQPDKDLSLVSAHFMIWLLDVELVAYKTEASQAIVVLYQRRLTGDEPSVAAWGAAYAAHAEADAAADAAAYAAYAAARAAHAAAYAAYAAVYAAHAAADAAYVRTADKLIELLVAV